MGFFCSSKYFESFKEGNSLYIAMELVEGMSLQYYLNYLEEQKKPMEEEEIWNIFCSFVWPCATCTRTSGWCTEI